MRSNSTAAWTRIAGFRISDGQLARHVRSQLVLGILAAEGLEHLDGAIPLLEDDQLGRRVVLRRGADLRIRRDSRHAQEILDRAGTVAALLLGLALLVHRGREPFGQIHAQLLVGSARARALRRMPFRPCRRRRGRSTTAPRWSMQCAASPHPLEAGARGSSARPRSRAAGPSTAKISSAARVSTPALSGCSGNALRKAQAGVRGAWHASSALAGAGETALPPFDKPRAPRRPLPRISRSADTHTRCARTPWRRRRTDRSRTTSRPAGSSWQRNPDRRGRTAGSRDTSARLPGSPRYAWTSAPSRESESRRPSGWS